MLQHAKLSASGASRWLACPPSVRLEENFPNKSTSYTKEGTLAHEIGEYQVRYILGMTDMQECLDHLEALEEHEYFTTEMKEHTEAYAEYIATRYKAIQEQCKDAFVEIEKRVDFSKWVQEGFGTCDCCIIADDTLEIIDFKYGKGHKVNAENNAQMQLYALGAIEAYSILYDIQKVKMTIFQPRLASISEAEITVEELLKWAEEIVKPRAILAYNGQGEFAPSEETCKFCKAKNQCKARAEENLKLFDENPNLSILTVDEVGKILEKAGDMKNWLSDIENFITATLLSGEEVNGWKLVEGRSIRRLTDEIKVVEILKKAGYDEKLLYKPKELNSLTQLEKDLGKKAVGDLLKDYIEKPQGKPTLVPESDKRPAINLKEQLLKLFD